MRGLRFTLSSVTNSPEQRRKSLSDDALDSEDDLPAYKGSM